MAKKPKPGKCVHCLNHFTELNWDHVFPKSWYPDTTSNDLYKWQIPSCIKCNDEYGRIEKELMITIGLCLDPNDPASSGIVNKALRSIDPTCAKNKKDKKAREAKRKEIFGKFISESNIPTSSIYPNFGPHPIEPEEQMGITVNASSIRRLNEKIVRGVMYIEDGILIEKPYIVDSFVVTDKAATPIIEIIKKHGVIHAREPGIIVKRVTVERDKLTSLFAIEIWGKFNMYSSIELENA